jgi:hypothetical protein
VTDAYCISWYDRFPAAEHVKMGLSMPSAHLSAAVGGGAAPATSISVAASLVVTDQAKPTLGALFPANDKSNRVKYACSCSINVWGRPGLRMQCLDCGQQFEASSIASKIYD